MVAAAMVGAAAVGAAGSAYSSKQAKKAANSQSQAATDAASMQLEQYNQTRDDLKPYTDAGKYGLDQLLSGYKDGSLTKQFGLTDYQQDPGYQFRLQQGMNGIQGSAAAGGGLLSGATLKALNTYNSDMASQEYNNAYTRFNNDQQNRYARLKDLANMGQNSAVQTGTMGQSAVGAAGANLTSGANASAAGTVASANNWNNYANQLGSMATMYAMNKNSGVI